MISSRRQLRGSARREHLRFAAGGDRAHPRRDLREGVAGSSPRCNRSWTWKGAAQRLHHRRPEAFRGDGREHVRAKSRHCRSGSHEKFLRGISARSRSPRSRVGKSACASKRRISRLVRSRSHRRRDMRYGAARRRRTPGSRRLQGRLPDRCEQRCACADGDCRGSACGGKQARHVLVEPFEARRIDAARRQGDPAGDPCSAVTAGASFRPEREGNRRRGRRPGCQACGAMASGG